MQNILSNRRWLCLLYEHGTNVLIICMPNEMLIKNRYLKRARRRNWVHRPMRHLTYQYLFWLRGSSNRQMIPPHLSTIQQLSWYKIQFQVLHQCQYLLFHLRVLKVGRSYNDFLQYLRSFNQWLKQKQYNKVMYQKDKTIKDKRSKGRMK